MKSFSREIIRQRRGSNFRYLGVRVSATQNCLAQRIHKKVDLFTCMWQNPRMYITIVLSIRVRLIVFKLIFKKQLHLKETQDLLTTLTPAAGHH